MFTIKVSEEVLAHSKSQIETFNFGKRSSANGNSEQQLTGIIGQSVVMELFGMGKVDGKQGFDKGIDLMYNHKKIDVKTMGRTTGVRSSYTNNFLKLQDYFDTEIYIFCSFHKIKNEVTVCGWIAKADFVAKRKYFPKGSSRIRNDGTSFTTFADLFEIDIKDLNDCNGIDDLKRQLDNLE